MASAAWADGCDAVLTESYQYSNTSSEYQYAWLNSVTDSTYTKAKQTAGAKYSNLFSGDYSAFKSKLSQRMSNESVSINAREASEILKIGLTPPQIDAWSKCRSAGLELAVTYKDVTRDAATIVLSWLRTNAFIPPLTDIRIDLRNATLDADAPLSVDGTKSLLITRMDASKPIRGTISGKAESGAQIKTVEAYVYIPMESDVPKKRIVPLANYIYRSVAHWRAGSKAFDGPPPPAGKELVIVEEAANNIGKHRGKYVPGAPYCDGYHEYCVEHTVVKGCYINTDWHTWYTNNVVVYQKADVCEG